MTTERYRSWLFAPADAPDRCRKAYDSGADQVIWDLEDGVASERKDQARASLLTLLDEVPKGGRRPWVRVNSLGTDRGQEDLRLLTSRVPEGRRRIVLPKADLQAFTSVPPSLGGDEWLLLIERADALMDLLDGPPLPQADDPPSVRLAFGPLDYQLDLGGSTGGDEAELLVPRSLIVLASRRRGLPPPIDGIWTAVDDTEGLAASAGRARRLGFAGKLAIHPRQLTTLHQAFTPSEREVAWARRVVTEAEAGAVLVDGEMVDRPALERARRILADIDGEGDPT